MERCPGWNGLAVGQLWRRVVEVTGGGWTQKGEAWQSNALTYFVSTACLGVCPAASISKREDGIVIIDADKCIGCRYCEWACPYGAPQFNTATGKMGKRNFCYDYLEAGQSPACVGSCPMRVLEFGELSELQARYGTTADIYPLPEPTIGPSVVFTPHKDSIRAKTEPARIGNEEEV